MKIYQCENYEKMSRTAANIISAQVIFKPDCVLGLATGSTPVGAYSQLIRWYNKGDLTFSQVRTVNLDEYVGLAPTHDQSYRYFMQSNFFDHINIKPENTHLPNGLADDISAECDAYNNKIADLGGIDMQLLGIGHNGHVGFNEPGGAFELGTHEMMLSESTLNANARFFDNDPNKVPKSALTMGIKNIMQAKKILVAVSDLSKADIVYQAFCGPVMPEVPASILQLHPDVTLVGDSDALSKLMAAKHSYTVML